MIHNCQEPDCNEPGVACFLPLCDEDETEEPDYYYCSSHAAKNGFCFGCGNFWGGVEAFDFSPIKGLCPNCRSELEEDDEELEDEFNYLP